MEGTTKGILLLNAPVPSSTIHDIPYQICYNMKCIVRYFTYSIYIYTYIYIHIYIYIDI